MAVRLWLGLTFAIAHSRGYSYRAVPPGVALRCHMTKPKLTSTKDPGRTQRVINFISDGYSDYVTARVLFLSDLPVQGAILASTAIEKCFKALMAVHGNESHGHLKRAHWNAIAKMSPEYYAALDPKFLTLNQRCYQLRYSEDLSPGFNAVIATREYLAELDFTILSILQRFVIRENDKKIITDYDSALERHDERLWQENHVLLKEDKAAFIAREQQYVYEIRCVENRARLEAVYWTVAAPKNPNFLRPAWLPKGTVGTTFDFAFAPNRPDDLAA